MLNLRSLDEHFTCISFNSKQSGVWARRIIQGGLTQQEKEKETRENHFTKKSVTKGQ